MAKQRLPGHLIVGIIKGIQLQSHLTLDERKLIKSRNERNRASHHIIEKGKKSTQTTLSPFPSQQDSPLHLHVKVDFL